MISIFTFMFNFALIDSNEDTEKKDYVSCVNDNYESCESIIKNNTGMVICNVTKDIEISMLINETKVYFLNYIKNFNYNGTSISAEFSCGQEDKTCGVDNPKELYECREHSTKTASCCKLKGPGVSNCILSGKKYEKYTNFTLFDEYFIECNETILLINYFLLVIIMLFIFI